ncbi:MAG: DoxX family protein [Alphaproteobacteria bacterium 64-11]|nr:DoxX family protein [Alphaproteobacteria bacterium]OJU12574.1 MAG: DoxX family protein [Alphaproteobacteria bacterium 64-11]
MGFLDRYAAQILGLVRIVSGLAFLEHGTSKLLNFPPGHTVELMSRSGAAGVIELVGGTLIILGLYSRTAAFIASGEMAFAYFLAHNPRSFFPTQNGGDAAILFCFIFLYLAAAGPGAFAMNKK